MAKKKSPFVPQTFTTSGSPHPRIVKKSPGPAIVRGASAFEMHRAGDPPGTFRTCWRCGYPNRKWKHPSDAVIERVRKYLAAVVESDSDAAALNVALCGLRLLPPVKKGTR